MRLACSLTRRPAYEPQFKSWENVGESSFKEIETKAILDSLIVTKGKWK